MIEDNKIEQMATVISNFCDKHQYDLTEQEIDDIALDMADKGYGNVREYEKRLCDKYIEIDNLNRVDSEAYENTVDVTDFADTFGYDNYIKAKKAYQECKKQSERLRKLFDDNEIAILQESI